MANHTYSGNLTSDLRFALRSLRRAPGFTLTAVLTLALGIGLTAAMYGIARQALLAPLPYAAPDRLVALNIGFAGEPPSASQVGAASDYLRANAHSYQSVGLSDGGPSTVNVAGFRAGEQHAFPAQGLRVSADFLPTLGIYPRLGRAFTADEARPGGPRAVLLSDALWRARFAADPDIVGRTIRLDKEAVPVVGVLPPGVVADMQGGTGDSDPAGIFQPLQLSPKDPGYDGTNYAMIARLRDGVDLRTAQQELDVLLPGFAKQYSWYSRWQAPDGSHPRLLVHPLHTALVGDVRSSLLLLLAGATAVLCIACLNLAGLMVARTLNRTRELAVRSALGAGRAALVRLLLAEACVLAFTGALLGTAVARLLAQVFLADAPITVPRLQPLTALGPMAVAATALAVLSMLLFGLAPAALVVRRGVSAGLRSSGAQGRSAGFDRVGRVLVVAQVSLTFVMLTAASLLLHAFLTMRSISPGIAPEGVTVAQVILKGDLYSHTAHANSFTTLVTQQLAHTPGVEAAGVVNGLPLDRGLNDSGWPTGRKDEVRSIEARFANSGYLRAIGIPVLAGRGIQDTDTAGSPRIAVINQAMAKRWWPAGDAIGHRVNLGARDDYEIVGIARDTKEGSLLERSHLLAYTALAQASDAQTKMINNWFATTFVIRARRGADVAEALTAAIRQGDPDLPVNRLESMDAVVDRSMATPRFFSTVLSSVAAFTLLLAAVGLFGLLSYQVSQRTREVGVRMALGATRGGVLRGIVVRGFWLAAAGLGVGAVLSLGLPHLLSNVLWEFAAVHTTAHAARGEFGAASLVAFLLLLVALVASFVPARRASGIDPMVALRTE